MGAKILRKAVANKYEFVKDIDITKHCGMSPVGSARFRYAVGQNGLVVMVHYRNHERNLGSFGCYLMSGLEEARTRDYFFHRHARLLGISPEWLFDLILEHQPTIN